MKIGRNSPCPCQSGKKYKRCCGTGNSRPPLDSILQGVPANDERLNHFRLIAQNDPGVCADSDFWNELGCALGTSGHRRLAIKAFERSIEITPDETDAKVNLAGTLCDLGNHAEAMAMLRAVPTTAPRRYVMLGNVAQALGRYADAIIYYEHATESEPDFSISWENLLNCLFRTESPAYELWLQRSHLKFPEVPSILYRWALLMHEQGRFTELLESAAIADLDTRRLSWRTQEDYEFAVGAVAWWRCALAALSDEPCELGESIEFLVGIGSPNLTCDAASCLGRLAAERGLPGIVESSLSARHRDCNTNSDALMARALRVAGEYEAALVRCEAALAEEDLLHVLDDYWRSLDELGRSNDALDALDRMSLFDDSSLEFRYNRGFVLSKCGRPGSAAIEYRHALEIDAKNPWAVECLAFVELLDRSFDSATSLMADHSKASALQDLVAFAKSRESSSSFARDVIDWNASRKIAIGSPMSLRPRPYSPSEILHDLDDQSSREDFKRYMRAVAKGDYSHAVEGLREKIPSWDSIPAPARSALMEAEHRFLQEESLDYAPTVVGYAKAVEIVLEQFVFNEFRRFVTSSPNAITLLDGLRGDPSFKTLVKYVEGSGHLELGGMILNLRRSRGRTAKKHALFAELSRFVETRGISCIVEKNFCDRCEELSKVRNPAAHAETYSRSDAFHARGLSLTLLSELPATLRT